MSDPFNRPPITEPIRQAIRDAFAVVPEGRSSAVIAIYDLESEEGRLHIAWKAHESDRWSWKVGAVVGIPVHRRPYGTVAVEVAW